MSFDYFVGSLRCAACKAKTAPDGRSNSQTKLREAPAMECLGVGAKLKVTPETAHDAGYVALRLVSGTELRILQAWECPACGAPDNWLEVTVRAGRITAVESVRLGAAALERAHYAMEDDLLDEAARRSGRRLQGRS